MRENINTNDTNSFKVWHEIQIHFAHFVTEILTINIMLNDYIWSAKINYQYKIFMFFISREHTKTQHIPMITTKFSTLYTIVCSSL